LRQIRSNDLLVLFQQPSHVLLTSWANAYLPGDNCYAWPWLSLRSPGILSSAPQTGPSKTQPATRNVDLQSTLLIDNNRHGSRFLALSAPPRVRRAGLADDAQRVAAAAAEALFPAFIAITVADSDAAPTRRAIQKHVGDVDRHLFREPAPLRIL